MFGIHPLKLTKSVVDPIHGLVRMTDEEHAVVNSRVFRRLRDIKQNGLLHLVFPSATHTRFEHSLGVVFVADSMLQALYFNSHAERGLTDAEEHTGQAVHFGRVEQETLRWIFQVTRLAALVHDLGHGPFSHTFDKFAPRGAPIAHLLDHEPILAPLKPLREALLTKVKNPERDPVQHETISCILLCWHFYKVPPTYEWLPLAVATAVLGRKTAPVIPAGLPRALCPWMPLIQDIIASAPVDVDRMDYVERDSRSCGVNYGLYDRDRILKSALCYRHSEDAYRLGWKISGLRAIEVFIHARFQLYAQIYYHKTNSAANLMMADIATYAADHNIGVFNGDSLSAIVDEYCTLGDDRFLRMLCGYVDGRLQRAAKIHPIARRIADRDLYKRVFESTPTMSSQDMQAELDRWHPEAQHHLRLDDSPLQATKDLNKGAVLLRRNANDIYAAPKNEEDWTQASPLIRTLQDEERKISRLYWTGLNDKNSPLEELRSSARRIVDPHRSGASNER